MEGGTIATHQENDMTTLTHSIIEWRRIKEKCDDAKQELRENNKTLKILEDIILRIMKNHNIGALDLKNSGGRVLCKKQKRQTAVGQKNMVKLMAEHLKSEEQAVNLMKYIQDSRQTVTTEKITYEKTE
jgi:hypothetical protein